MFLGGSGEVFLGRDYSQHTAYSEAIAGQIDDEVKIIIDENYQRALKILQDNRTILDNMVKVLYEKNTIYTEEVDMLFDGKSAEEIIKSIEEKMAKREEYKKVEQPTEITSVQVKADGENKADNNELNKADIRQTKAENEGITALESEQKATEQDSVKEEQNLDKTDNDK